MPVSAFSPGYEIESVGYVMYEQVNPLDLAARKVPVCAGSVGGGERAGLGNIIRCDRRGRLIAL